ncbi:MAG: FMN-binding protein [Akkermansiaceae bacterium]
MNRRTYLKKFLLAAGCVCASSNYVHAKVYLTVDQAKRSLCGSTSLKPVSVELTKEQMKSIKSASKVRVRNAKVHAWKTSDGGWFIVDQVIGKHEFIDIAVALSSSGTVKGVDILTYRESYGHEVINPKWLAQFRGKKSGANLKIDREIRNISGATLSSVHVMEGVNRLTETWAQVLRYL